MFIQYVLGCALNCISENSYFQGAFLALLMLKGTRVHKILLRTKCPYFFVLRLKKKANRSVVCKSEAELLFM